MKKLVTVIISCLMASILVLVSCGTTTEQTSSTTEVKGTVVNPTSTTSAPTQTTTIAPTTATTTTTAASQGPKYGGMLTLVQRADITIFDSAAGQLGTTGMGALSLTNECLLGDDWAKGPSGTGEFSLNAGFEKIEGLTGMLAEDWQVNSIGDITFTIRKDVHYFMNPASDASKVSNGRQLTVDDIIWNIRRYADSPLSAHRRVLPQVANTIEATKIDQWTINLKTPEDPWSAFSYYVYGSTYIFPPEVIQKYGDTKDWYNVVGTGPFMMTDYVKGSSATLVRNPNWWGTDPIGAGKGNQIPYLDGVKVLTIPDISTQLAAIRSAKADWVQPVSWSDALTLQKSNPQLQYKKQLQSPLIINLRQDKQDIPLGNLKVRQALSMAMDYPSMVNDLYGGNAETLAWPYWPVNAWEGIYIPLDQQPAAVQELFSYNPEKAKQLLKDAGYANGFTANIILASTPDNIDLVSVVKDMWSKIGVTLELQPKEAAVYNSIRAQRSMEEMILAPTPFATGKMNNYLDITRTGVWNQSHIDDPVINDYYYETQENIFINFPHVYEMYRDMVPYLLEQVYAIQLPAPYNYVFWQPWVKNYNGETMVHQGGCYYDWISWAWLDQDLKASMK